MLFNNLVSIKGLIILIIASLGLSILINSIIIGALLLLNFAASK